MLHRNRRREKQNQGIMPQQLKTVTLDSQNSTREKQGDNCQGGITRQMTTRAAGEWQLDPAPFSRSFYTTTHCASPIQRLALRIAPPANNNSFLVSQPAPHRTRRAREP